MDEAFWDARYREADAIWSGNPNPQLVAEVADLPPGTALDVGSGEGADAIWLAGRGWRVTAADLSSVALERAGRHAAAAGVADRITWLHADLTGQGPDRSYDLVSAQFMHLPGEQLRALHRRLAAAVAPGGTLLLVGHDLSDLEAVPRHLPPDMFFSAPDVAARLDPREWETLVAESRPRPALDPGGRPVVLRDATLRARRGQNRS